MKDCPAHIQELNQQSNACFRTWKIIRIPLEMKRNDDNNEGKFRKVYEHHLVNIQMTKRIVFSLNIFKTLT